jgi:hypothetical protein
MDRNHMPSAYEPPMVVEVGTVHALTQTIDKTWGPSDGFTFNNISIANAS